LIFGISQEFGMKNERKSVSLTIMKNVHAFKKTTQEAIEYNFQMSKTATTISPALHIQPSLMVLYVVE
jgi:hypothetical protein